MEIQTVDPDTIALDSMNERSATGADADLVKNVEQFGVVMPPLVRRLNGAAPEKFSVVVGSRRVDAAVAADLDEIDVIVVDWDDGEALAKSIVENVDAFREDVSKKDRAKAIERLKELNDWANSDVADHLGVNIKTVRAWLEPIRPEWEGTSIHADTKEFNAPNGKEPTDKAMQVARSLTGGGEEGEAAVEAMEKTGVRETKDVGEVEQRVKQRHGDSATASQIEDVAAEVAAEKQGGEADTRRYIDFTATGAFADAIEFAGEDCGMTPREVVRRATKEWLEEEGYL